MAAMGKKETQSAKESILKAAEELFAEKGFASTAISRIAEKSGQSGSLVMFHFKNKKGLYEAVKAAIVERYAECLPAPIDDGKTLTTILHRLIRTMFYNYKNNPMMVRIANWSRLEGEDESWPGEDDWHHRYVEQIRAAQREGEIRDDVSPLRALIIIEGAVHVWWEHHDRLLRDVDQAADPDSADERYFEDLMAVLLRGLSPIAGEGPSDVSRKQESGPPGVNKKERTR
jgi:TetR/AcrR family transcriptional regulator